MIAMKPCNLCMYSTNDQNSEVHHGIINWSYAYHYHFALCSVTCILIWATYNQNPSCPQCKHPFQFLNVHRSLDGR